jgi:hypothetical protein
MDRMLQTRAAISLNNWNNAKKYSTHLAEPGEIAQVRNSAEFGSIMDSLKPTRELVLDNFMSGNFPTDPAALTPQRVWDYLKDRKSLTDPVVIAVGRATVAGDWNITGKLSPPGATTITLPSVVIIGVDLKIDAKSSFSVGETGRMVFWSESFAPTYERGSLFTRHGSSVDRG